MAKMVGTLYARYEATSDGIENLLKGKQDVALYSDEACIQIKARIPWYAGNKPSRKDKTIVLNSARYLLVWK